MELLPTPHQRSALLDGLSRLIERQGFETFVRAPILEPSSTHFPDVWEPSERGVRALSLRLLAYAGLGELDADVALYDEDHAGEGFHQGTAAWFAGIEDGTCVFGADTRQLESGDAIVGTMCHEVAHAYREHHGLVGPHRQMEEEDTDITTVFLGFGILTTNNAYRFRKTGEMVGTMVSTKWSTSQTGYLSPQSMAFLLAAQAVARGLDKSEVKAVAALLEPNQRDFFRAAHKELAQDPDALRVALGIPPEEAWPSERELEVPSLRPDARFEPREEPSPSERPPWNVGANVFRVRRTKARRWAWGGSVVGLLAGCWVGARAEGEGWRWAFAGMLGFALLGALAGTTRRADECSEPRCEARIGDPDARTCPRCGATIAGVIGDAADRLEVEEAIEEGRPVSDAVAAIARRRRRGRVRTGLGIALVVAVVGLLMFSDRIPRPAAIRSARAHAQEPVTLRITGEVVQRLDGDGMLVSEDRSQELTAFVMADDTDTLEVWYDPRSLDGDLAKGRRVRVWGRFVPMRVRSEGTSTDSRRFVASSVSVDR